MAKTIRIAAWTLLALVVAALVFVLYFDKSGLTRIAGAGIGGPFQLVRHDGAPIDETALAGKPYAMFFGFTHCPEVCPTTLYEASGWLERLGEKSDGIGIYFVTVDPERDTPEVLANYLSAFPGITGITGDAEGIAEIEKAYKVYARKVPLADGDYTMDHTATVYLMDSSGEFQGTIAWREDPEIAFEKIRRLVDKG